MNGSSGRNGGGPSTSRGAGAKSAGTKSLFDRLSGPGAGNSGARSRYERDEDVHEEVKEMDKKIENEDPAIIKE